ncbi:Uncharacterised protein [uncultured archaeon]|nr:Uncharacterised protein [uncultured archaeon]
MTASLADSLYFPAQILASVFSALDSVKFSDYNFSLLDIFLGFIFLVLTLEFIFYMFDVDIDLWSYVFGDEDDD